MTKEYLQQKIDILQAYIDGKTIETLDGCGQWVEAKENDIKIRLFTAMLRIKEEENPTIEQNAGENRIEGGVLSLSDAPKEFINHCQWCIGKGWHCVNCDYKNEEDSYYLLHKEKFSEQCEKHYRPFKNCDELVECWKQKMHLVYIKDKRDKLDRPTIWIYHKKDYTERLIVTFGEGFVKVGSKTKPVSLQDLFTDYTFLDGSVCGILEE